jgi:hypothetical protein
VGAAIVGTPVTTLGTFFSATLTQSVTVSAGQSLVVVLAWQSDSAEPTGCAFGAQSFTKISPATSPTNGGKRVAAYVLKDPTPGTANVVMSHGNFTPSMTVYILSGVDQTTPTADWNSATAPFPSGTVSVDVSNVATGDITIDITATGADGTAVNNFTPGAGQTEWADTRIATSGGRYVTSSDDTSTGTVTQSYTFSGDDWVAGAFRVVGAAAASGRPFFTRLGGQRL